MRGFSDHFETLSDVDVYPVASVLLFQAFSLSEYPLGTIDCWLCKVGYGLEARSWRDVEMAAAFPKSTRGLSRQVADDFYSLLVRI